MLTSTYTYQGGEKLELRCETHHFISRSTEAALLRHDFKPLRAVSPHSWSVATTVERLDEDIRLARNIGPAYRAYVVAASGAPFRVTDRLFIRFRHETSCGDAQRFGARVGLKVLECLSPRDFLCRVPQHVDAVEIVRLVTEQELNEVEIIDHDLNVRPHVHEGAAGESVSAPQWQLRSAVDDDPLVDYRALLDCEGAWKANGYGDPDVVIAVVDSGCDLSDPNFEAGKFVDWAVMMDGELLSSSDFATRESESIMDPSQLHGTLCATLAAASVNDRVGVGVAPNCSLLPVKWQDLGGTTTFPQSLFARVVRFLRDKADIVSNSWNRGANGYWPPYLCELLKDAALNGGRHGKGMVWVWAAGNRNIPIQHLPNRHGRHMKVPIAVSGDGDALQVTDSSSEFVNSFVGIPGVLHVGAISSLGKRCHYSNYGTGLDLVAPSGNFNLYGRGVAPGVDVQAPLGREGLHPFNGTSASAPLVAGVAALVRSANPWLTSTEVVSLLRRTADRELDTTGYPRSSRPTDPDPAWDVSPVPPFDSGCFVSNGHSDGPWSPWFGFGKVNARKAVEAALCR